MMPVAMEGVAVMKNDGFGEIFILGSRCVREVESAAAPGTGAKIPLLIS